MRFAYVLNSKDVAIMKLDFSTNFGVHKSGLTKKKYSIIIIVNCAIYPPCPGLLIEAEVRQGKRCGVTSEATLQSRGWLEP